MKRLSVVLSVALVGLLGFSFLAPATAEEGATRDKCIAKAQEAAKLIKDVGHEAAFQKISDRKGQFKWKGGYLWVMDDEKAKVLAHYSSYYRGRFFLYEKDADGKFYCQEAIRIAKTKGQGWISCNEETCKRECYILKVPGENFIVVAFYYP